MSPKQKIKSGHKSGHSREIRQPEMETPDKSRSPQNVKSAKKSRKHSREHSRSQPIMQRDERARTVTTLQTDHMLTSVHDDPLLNSKSQLREYDSQGNFVKINISPKPKRKIKARNNP